MTDEIERLRGILECVEPEERRRATSAYDHKLALKEHRSVPGCTCAHCEVLARTTLTFEQREDGIHYLGEPPARIKLDLRHLASCDPRYVQTDDNEITITCQNGTLRYQVTGPAEMAGVVWARKVEG